MPPPAPRTGSSEGPAIDGANDGDAVEEPVELKIGIISGWSGRGSRNRFMDLITGVGEKVRLKWKPRPGFSPQIFGTVAYSVLDGAVAEIALIDRNDATYPTHTRRWLRAEVIEVDVALQKTFLEISSSVEVYNKIRHRLAVRTSFLGSSDFVCGSKVLVSTQRFVTKSGKVAVGIDTCEADPLEDEKAHRFAPSTTLLTKLSSSFKSNFVIGDRRDNSGKLSFNTGDISFIDTSIPGRIIPRMIDFVMDRCEKELAAWNLLRLAVASGVHLSSSHLRPWEEVCHDLETLEKARSGSRPLNCVIFPHSFRKIHPEAWPEIIDAFDKSKTAVKVNSFALLEVLDRSMDKRNFHQLCDRGFRLSPMGSSHTRSSVFDKDISLGYMTSRRTWTFKRSSSSHRVAFHHFTTHMVMAEPEVDFVDVDDVELIGDGQSDDEDCSVSSVIASASQKDIANYPGLLSKLQSLSINCHRRNTDFAHHNAEFQHFTVLTDKPVETAESIRGYSPNGFSPFAAITYKELSTSKHLIHIGFAGAPSYTALTKIIGQVPALCKSKVITIVWEQNIEVLTKLLREANEKLARAGCVRPFVAVVAADSAPLWIIERPVAADAVGLDSYAPGTSLSADYGKLRFIDGPQPGIESPASLRKILLHHGVREADCDAAQWRRGINDSSSFWLCARLDSPVVVDGISLPNGQKTELEPETPIDTELVYFVFREQATLPLVSLADYAPLPPSLLYSDTKNSYHNYFVTPLPPPSKQKNGGSSERRKAASATVRRPPGEPRALAPVFEEQLQGKKASQAKPRAKEGQRFQGVQGGAAPREEEVIKINGVASKNNPDKAKEPPQLFLRVVWRRHGSSKSETSFEPCDNFSAMSLPKARTWTGVSANMLFARKESRRGVIAFLDGDLECSDCFRFATAKKGKVKDCSKDGCEIRRIAETEVSRLRDATSHAKALSVDGADENGESGESSDSPSENDTY